MFNIFYLFVKRDLFSAFLKTIEHHAADDVLTYDFHSIEYEWAIANNQNESGTYVAYCMEHFLGYKDMMSFIACMYKKNVWKF